MNFDIMKVLTSLALVTGLATTPLQAQGINPSDGGTPYANVRGWSVFSMADGRGIYGCRAVRGYGYNDQIMVDYDGFSEAWSLIVPANRPGGGGIGIKGAVAYYDGSMVDSQVGFGVPGADGSSDTHARLMLEANTMGRFKSGSTLRLDINGEASRSYALTGTTAAVLKVVECAQSFGMSDAALSIGMGRAAGGGGAAAPALPTAPAAPAGGVNGYSVGYVVYPGGQFRNVGGTGWVEEASNGNVKAYFEEYGRDADSVFLHDASRDLQIWIALTPGEIGITHNGNNNAWGYLYSIDCYDREASRAC